MIPLHPFAFIIVTLLGLALGSFGNVLLVRIAETSSIRGRSRCPKCRHPIAWRDLVPILSYLLLRGRCRRCAASIAPIYPFIEGMTAILFIAALLLSDGDVYLFAGFAVFLWGLLLAGTYDARSGLLPDALTVIVTVGAVIIMIAHDAFVSGILGAIIGFAWFGWQWIVSRGRAVGSGDILLGASIGIALGMRGTVTMLVVSYIIGALVAAVLLITGKAGRGSQIPFAPFLAVGTLLALIGIGDVYVMFLTRTF